MLLPNKQMLDLTLAADFLGSRATVRVAPPIEVFSTWAEKLSVTMVLLEGQPVPVTASSLQQQQAWMEAVSAHEAVRSSGLRLLARQAQAASRLLNQWFSADDLPWLDARFLAWRHAVAANLARQGLFSPEQWLQHVTSRLESSQELPVKLPQRITFRGFIEFTRLEQELLAALGGRGVVVYVEEQPPDHGAVAADVRQPQQVAYPSPEEELRAAAEWAAQQVARHIPRIALVIPDLENRAAQVTRALDRTLHPRDGLKVAWSGESQFCLPVGMALADHSLIADALMLLRLSSQGAARNHGFPVPSRLILSPALQGAAVERHARAVFESRLREEGRHWLSLKELRRQAERWSMQKEVPVLHQLLSKPPRFTAGEDPAAAAQSCLAAWGWPGPSASGQQAQARVDRFVNLLEELRPLSDLAVQPWLDLLQQACRDARLCERGGPLSPVQVMAPEDAVGQRFDAARILDLHADNWPGRPTANPFLPAQAAEVIPRTSPEGSLAYSRKLQRHLECLAGEVTFTWAFKAGDAPRLASPLVEAVCAPLSEPAIEPQAEPWSALQASDPPLAGYVNHPWLQAVEDTMGLPLDHAGNNRIPGGATMLKLQAGCPLQAYLHYRLDGRFEDMPGPFPDYAWRGKVLHAALQHLYEPHKGWPGTPDANGIAAAVEWGMEQGAAAYRLSAAALEAERSRLQRVLRDWLALDRQRPFFTVIETEQQDEFLYRGYSIRVRNDRIDQLADGSRLLIDYKSGSVSTADWKRDRNLQPQLPLYAVLLQGREHESESVTLGGLALASVRPGECKYVGTTHHPDVQFTGVKATGSSKSTDEQRVAEWTALTTHWSESIDLLALEIIGGEAANRLFKKDALKYSNLGPVLRRVEGEAWLTAHGAYTGGGDDEAGDSDD